MNFNTTTMYMIYVTLLLFIITIIYYTIKYTTYKEGIETITPVSTPSPGLLTKDINKSTTNYTISNKHVTSKIGSKTQQSALSAIQSKINECQVLIGSINSKLPNSISDIVPGTVSQSSDLSDVQFRINNEPYETQNPFDPSGTMMVGKWTIGVILPDAPRGEMGSKGDDGQQGIPGPIGDSGNQGERGEFATFPTSFNSQIVPS
jgi:hypothetical protein